MKRACVLAVFVLCLCGLAAGMPELYFADYDGNAISKLSVAANNDITVYVYGSADVGNMYDYFNIGLAYDPAKVSPKTGVAAFDLIMSTASTFGEPFGRQETIYEGTSLLSGAASSMSGPPAGFGPTLLATAYFTFNGGPTEISMFDEADEYTYSTFFLDTNTFTEKRFSDTLTITQIPEPMMAIIFAGSILYIVKKRKFDTCK